MITTALALAKLIPGVVGLFSGGKDDSLANKVVNIAKEVTGLNEPKSALEQIQKNPDLLIKYKTAMAPVVTAEIQAQAENIKQINETMRHEYANKSWFKSGWRPAFGWAVVITWFTQMAAITYIMIEETHRASEIIAAMASLSFMWAMALGALGINIHKRSQDKALAEGVVKPSLLESMVGMFKG